jgi:hypothetical protein
MAAACNPRLGPVGQCRVRPRTGPPHASEQLFGLTTPLITTASGAKMGKTATGAVWLNQDMLSVYDYWQFWRNSEDGDVGRFLRLFTDMPLDEIARLESCKAPNERGQKNIGDRGDRDPAWPRGGGKSRPYRAPGL